MGWFMRAIVVGVCILLLIVAHQLPQYARLWDSEAVCFGFLPAGLVYHAGLSIAAAVFWAFAVCWAWPLDREETSARTEGDA